MTNPRELRLFIDDEREAPDETWIPAMTVSNALTMLELARANDEVRFAAVSLDYDLGFGNVFDYDTGFEPLTTIPILEWMIDKDYWPDDIYVHTANLDGEEELLRMIAERAPLRSLRGYGCNYWGTGPDSVVQVKFPV
jgi:hypothetical protein